MTESTVPASIALCRDPASFPSDFGLRAIDLAPPAPCDRLDEDARAALARAGQEALEACLSRFAPAERAAFWLAIGRCYNRPYNPPGAPAVEIAVAPADAVPIDSVPAAHVIDAVRPGLEAARPEAALR